MDTLPFRTLLYLPAQGAAESEATIIQWNVSEGDHFRTGEVLAQVDSAKSVFDFQSPCDGLVIRRLHPEGETVLFSEPVVEIETSDPGMKDWIPPPAESEERKAESEERRAESREPVPDAAFSFQPSAFSSPLSPVRSPGSCGVVLRGVGGYLPRRVVTNAELVEGFQYKAESGKSRAGAPSTFGSRLSPEYVYQVTGIRQRHWAEEGEKPSEMALKASLEAIRSSEISTQQIDAIILATTTPDMAMPSTASILQDRLSLPSIPAFDLNAACSGWLYAAAMAFGMIRGGLARNVLTVGVDVQSRLLDPSDRNAYFLFGDGAGAAIISAGDGGDLGISGSRDPRPSENSAHPVTPSPCHPLRLSRGRPVREVILGADTGGLHLARREDPGYKVPNGGGEIDPWIRLDGPALFRLATDTLAAVIRQGLAQTGWSPQEIRWVIPHQANARILKAAARRSGVSFGRFYLNLERVGNTSSASIPLALAEVQQSLQPGDKLLLCSVGAGMTRAAISVQW
jgi:3-oxoacyl-[acyl-carrier-protein] synthase III